MLDRIALTVLIIAIAAGLYWLYRRHLLSQRAGTALQLKGYQPGQPAILYFSSPDCAPCQTIQKPALKRLMDLRSGGLQVIEVNALESPELADEWGVLSLPTTFVIDSRAQPRGVNHGAVRESTLMKQLSRIGEWPPVSGSAQPARAEDQLGSLGRLE
jgi:thioredoxin-like negative regulator of GroEL